MHLLSISIALKLEIFYVVTTHTHTQKEETAHHLLEAHAFKSCSVINLSHKVWSCPFRWKEEQGCELEQETEVRKSKMKREEGGRNVVPSFHVQ